MLFFFVSSIFAASIDITVVDARTGAPLEGVEVLCQDSQGTKSSTLPNTSTVEYPKTNRNGQLQIACASGKQNIILMHPDYGKKELPFQIDADGLKVRIRLESSTTIIVEGEQETNAVNRQVFDAEELKQIPGTFGDPVRALQSLPGVARPNIAEGSIVVRGAEGINTGFYVDGMPVPYMFHTLVGRSIIIPSFIDDVEFFPGGMPSNYGEVTQAAVNIRTNTTPVQGSKAQIRLDFLDGSLALEHRIRDDMVLRSAYRYSWVAGLISSAAKYNMRRIGANSDEATYVAPKYWDGFADWRWQINANDEISLLYLQSRDALYYHQGRFDSDGDGEADPLEWEEYDLGYNPEYWIDNQFWRSRLTWNHEENKHHHRTWVATGFEEQQNLLGAWWLARQGPYRGRVGGNSIIVRRDDTWSMPEWGDGSALVAGGQLTSRWFQAEDFQNTFSNLEQDTVERVITEDQQISASIWIEPQLRTEKYYLGLGLRGGYYQWDNQETWQPEPRFSARLYSSDDQLWKMSLGRYSQVPTMDRYAQGIGNPDLNVMKAWQWSLGTEKSLGNGIEIDSSVFTGWMTDLVIRDLKVDMYNNGDMVTTELEPYYRNVQGSAYGWEALIRYRPNQSNFWGWISLTMAKAFRQDEEGNLFPSDYDQPLSLTTVCAYDLGRNMEVSSRVQWTSGQPYTPLYGVYIPTDQYFTAIRGELNSERYPYFFRIDTRFQKVWHLKQTDWMGYIDIYNTSNRKNPFLAMYNYDYTELIDLVFIPIIPTIGIEVSY